MEAIKIHIMKTSCQNSCKKNSYFIAILVALCINQYGCSSNPSSTYSKSDQVTYYIDSKTGNDHNTGKSKNSAWKSLSKIEYIQLHPGDSLRFKRGSSFVGPLIISSSGTKNNYITLTDYGDSTKPAPAFTNPVFEQGNYGNCIRLKGNYIIVENLYFHDTPAVPDNYPDQHFQTVWEMGAIYIDKGTDHCIVRNNEIENCVAGIRSYGQHTIIEYNFIHDCNRVLKKWSWGPLGIWLGANYQFVVHNRVFNYRVEDPRIHWASGIGGGADGGAFEIDDARYNKSHITIAYNYTRDCQGFLEVTAHDVQSAPKYRNFQIHHNISDDYQQFIALWAGSDCAIDNNTIIRRKVNVNDWGVFNITQNNSKNKVRNNIIITEKNIPIFNVGLNTIQHPNSIIENNLYYAASGKLETGHEGPGVSSVFANPLLVNYQAADQPADFSLTTGSPAIDHGSNLNYNTDFIGTMIPEGAASDIGAFEYYVN